MGGGELVDTDPLGLVDGEALVCWIGDGEVVVVPADVTDDVEVGADVGGEAAEVGVADEEEADVEVTSIEM